MLLKCTFLYDKLHSSSFPLISQLGNILTFLLFEIRCAGQITFLGGKGTIPRVFVPENKQEAC